MISNLELFQLPEPETVYALTLWQPWATWVAWGWKTIETRLHDRFAKLEGHVLAIHAALVWDKQGISAARPYLTPERLAKTYELLKDPKCPRGAVVCLTSVKRYAITERTDAACALIECDTPRYGLWLGEVFPVEPPYRCTGRQGIFRVPCPQQMEKL